MQDTDERLEEETPNWVRLILKVAKNKETPPENKR